MRPYSALAAAVRSSATRVVTLTPSSPSPSEPLIVLPRRSASVFALLRAGTTTLRSYVVRPSRLKAKRGAKSCAMNSGLAMITPMRSRFAAMNARASSARRNSSIFSGKDDAPARLPTIAVAASASFFSVSRGRVGKENDDRVTRLRRRWLLGHFLRRLRCFQVLLRNRFDRGRQIASDRAGERIARIDAGDEFRGSADEERERLSTFVE